jgi:hypothetical protein
MFDELGGHVSQNCLEGSLSDTPLDRLLAALHLHLVTGTIRVSARGGEGHLELRAGAVDCAEYGGATGEEAVAQMRRLRDGLYQVTQRLPDLSGALGSAARFEGNVAETPLVDLMRHCEGNALSCVITLISGFDRAELTYRAGDLVGVTYNGQVDEDRIVDMVRFRDARFRVAAPPLPIDIEGWPTVSREPTAPFCIEHLAARPRAGGRPAKAPGHLPGVGEPARPERATTQPERPAAARERTASQRTARRKSAPARTARQESAPARTARSAALTARPGPWRLASESGAPATTTLVGAVGVALVFAVATTLVSLCGLFAIAHYLRHGL